VRSRGGILGDGGKPHGGSCCTPTKWRTPNTTGTHPGLYTALITPIAPPWRPEAETYTPTPREREEVQGGLFGTIGASHDHGGERITPVVLSLVGYEPDARVGFLHVLQCPPTGAYRVLSIFASLQVSSAVDGGCSPGERRKHNVFECTPTNCTIAVPVRTPLRPRLSPVLSSRPPTASEAEPYVTGAVRHTGSGFGWAEEGDARVRLYPDKMRDGSSSAPIPGPVRVHCCAGRPLWWDFTWY
jgi:hypothetical protein